VKFVVNITDLKKIKYEKMTFLLCFIIRLRINSEIFWKSLFHWY